MSTYHIKYIKCILAESTAEIVNEKKKQLFWTTTVKKVFPSYLHVFELNIKMEGNVLQ